ncbi:MAG: heme exporter protein CcmD [Hyphomicrobiales bacterium]|nr:MAG: heme exporter protein CcmD [Hyphomicrobiales bacterium]
MIGDGAHLPFIAGSYVGVAVLVVGLLAYVAWDALRVKRKLAELDKAGIRRRSSDSASTRAETT